MRRTAAVVLALAAFASACGGESSEESSTTTSDSIVVTTSSSTTTEPPTTTTAAPPPATSPPTTSAPLPPTPAPTPPAPTSDLARAQANGVPGSGGAVVIYSGCWGRTSTTHWGYYNYLGTGTTVFEPDGAVVVPGQICLNPSQASPYSSLVHELGHRWFWENGLWNRVIAEYGNYQRAGECFAAIWGATVFGAGGCPAAQQQQMRAEFGW